MINVGRRATALPPESGPVGRFPNQEKRFWQFCWFCDKNEPYGTLARQNPPINRR